MKHILGVVAFVSIMVVAFIPRTSYYVGEAEAYWDTLNGRTVLRTYGDPPPYYDLAEKRLLEKYGIKLDRVAGCSL